MLKDKKLIHWSHWKSIAKSIGKGFDESCDGCVCDLEHGAGSLTVKVWRARHETCLKAKQFPYLSLLTDLCIPSAQNKMEERTKQLSKRANQRFLIDQLHNE